MSVFRVDKKRDPKLSQVRYCKRPLFDGLGPANAAVVHFACAKPWDWTLGKKKLEMVCRLDLKLVEMKRNERIYKEVDSTFLLVYFGQ